MLDANTWRVKSQSQTDVWHSVSALERRFYQDHCFEKCQELACLGLCSHLYHCNCDDNALLCKHIHKIHAFQVRMHHIARTEVEEADTADHFQGYSHELPLTTTDIPNEEDQPKSAPPERLLEATKLDVSKLEDMLQNEVVVRALLPQINGTLKRLLAQCTAVISSNDRLTQEPQLMHAAKMIQPNEKLQLQLRPMTKAPKRKVAAPIFTGPTASQKKELLNSLLSDMPEESKNDITVVASPPVKKSKLSLNKKTDKPKQQPCFHQRKVPPTSHQEPYMRPSRLFCHLP